ncbi:hypothetical protein [Ralstonia pseudosolanacearum]|uniref:hypothetical protein n=1 Tax=Ralstonia pseudosolanacearum TaxID=1310165 RepID=UPI0008DA6DA4|nr:hypothetical protein [Ralstonia pseudosolanacearum]MCL1622627.1 hypothetical protein [Ralstonia pseudosolanacearum CaRs-Mep]
MDIREFQKQVSPAQRRSKMHPWLADIQALRAGGYTIEQVRQYLAANQVIVAFSTLAAFIARQTPKGESARARAATVPPAKEATRTDATVSASQKKAELSYKTTEELAKENPTLNKRAILDLYARQFQVEPPNPLDELIRKQEERKRLQREQAAGSGAGAGSTPASG